jgi:hypothetical protein
MITPSPKYVFLLLQLFDENMKIECADVYLISTTAEKETYLHLLAAILQVSA